MYKSSIVVLLLLIGLYFPTSKNALISSDFLLINSVVLFLLLILLIFSGVKIFKIPFFISSGIMFLLLISTIISPFDEIKYGSGAYYLSLSLLFCLDLRGIKFGKKANFIINIANIFNIVLGIGIISQNINIANFIINNYSAFYELLVPNMISFQKPILTFATHSLAGFFVYLFFFINFTKYKAEKDKFPLIFSLFYVVFLLYISSSASLFFFGIAVIQILAVFFKMKRKNVIISLLGVSLLIVTFYKQLTTFLTFIVLQVEGEMLRTNGGLVGRYSENGNMHVNFEYLFENFFQPIGFGYSNQVILADSGMVEYLLRGTFLLVILIYVGLFLFLRNNLSSKRNANILFVLILLFEFGFTSLTYFRMIYLLPFIVVYLNTLNSKRPTTYET